MSNKALIEHFLQHLPTSVQASWARIPELEHTLHELIARCQAAWPQIGLPAERYVEHLACRVAEDSAPGTLPLHACDMYLALGGVRGGTAGVSLFDAHALLPQTKLLRKKGLSEDALQETMQALRVRLLIGTDSSPPRLLSYSGKAPLVSWVRAVALNFVHNERERASARTVELPDDEQLLRKLIPARLGPSELGVDVERVVAQQGSKPIVQDALRAALLRLNSHDRLLLKLCYMDGLRLQQIATLCHVDKSTISRHLAAARTSIREALRGELRDRLGLRASEADSMIRLVISQVDLSMSGLWASSTK